MLRYACRRLLQMIPVFFGATLLVYAMVFLLPGDPVAAMGGERSLSPAVQAQIRAEYNLDKPFLVQYLGVRDEAKMLGDKLNMSKQKKFHSSYLIRSQIVLKIFYILLLQVV